MSMENQGHCNRKEGRTYRNKTKKKIKPQQQVVSQMGVFRRTVGRKKHTQTEAGS